MYERAKNINILYLLQSHTKIILWKPFNNIFYKDTLTTQQKKKNLNHSYFSLAHLYSEEKQTKTKTHQTSLKMR